jgi:hypothetical protein
MANRTVFAGGQNAPPVELPYIYNVEQPVGKRVTSYTERNEPNGMIRCTTTFGRCPNAIDDVMLVQWLLKWCYVTENPEAGKMVVDGLCGPQTLRWIVGFQLRAKKRHCSINPDGCVDPASGGYASITHTAYTIIHLNTILQANNPDLYEDPSKDLAIPPILLARLRSVPALIIGP